MAEKYFLSILLSMPTRRVIPFSNGVYFITFTCCKWMPLIEITQGYDIVYKWFDIMRDKGNFILGFVFGYKIIGAFIIQDALNDPQSFILSSKGNTATGVLLGLFFLGLKWYEKNKEKLAKPEERIIRIWPQDRVGDLVIYAAAFGFLGAKIFHNLENWNEFIKDPIGALISFSGLTFYGGLICAGAAIMIYSKKIKLPIVHLVDSFAPILMLGYSIGRIGCQVSGDGDWGIVNLYPKPFNWLPDWLWAYQYPHNVVGECVAIPGCVVQY
jgi:hypothetical protein